MKQIGIIGYGEIGQALSKCYENKEYNVGIIDTGKGINSLDFTPSILNICIPFNASFDFVAVVSQYIDKLKPEITIIHSTATVGATKTIAQITKRNVVHSPVRGVHPHLYDGLMTFVKFVGANDEISKNLAVEHLTELGIKTEVFGSSDTTELAKILDTTYYGLCIAFHNDMNKMCEMFGVSFEEVATRWNTTYNEGYTKLGKTNVIRPVLYPPKDGKIGGHCVIPNAKLCKDLFDSLAFEYILRLK